MSLKFRSTGMRLIYSNSGSAILSGAVVVLRSGASGMIGIAETDIAATTGTGYVMTGGVHNLLKASGAISAWAVVYWNTSTGINTTNTTTHTKAGIAVAAATTAATSIDVLVNDRPATGLSD